MTVRIDGLGPGRVRDPDQAEEGQVPFLVARADRHGQHAQAAPGHLGIGLGGAAGALAA
jgi:hypothetical protein